MWQTACGSLGLCRPLYPPTHISEFTQGSQGLRSCLSYMSPSWRNVGRTGFTFCGQEQAGHPQTMRAPLESLEMGEDSSQ